MSGKIIVIDGMDGVGKQTQTSLIVKKLEEAGKLVYSFSFPNYEDDSSYFVKKFLNGEYKDTINDPLSISLFYTIDRVITFNKKIKELYDQGYIIILDRYYISNLIYNMHKANNEIIFARCLSIIENGCNLPIPDLTIILYSDPEISNKLLNNRYDNDDSKRDIFENMETQNQIYKNIKFIEKNIDEKWLTWGYGYIETIPIHNIHGELYTIEDINNRLMNSIYEVINEK